MILPLSYYLSEDVVSLARSFLGKILVTDIDGKLTSGIITETEAYAGESDKASHAYGGRKTDRTSVMYEEGGRAYIYLIYGMYSLFNIVTAPAGIPHAVLVRAIQPLDGIRHMEARRNRKNSNGFCNGPGKLTIALGLHFSDTGSSLLGNRIWIEDRGIIARNKNIIAGPRINVDYAEEDANLPYRFQCDLDFKLKITSNIE